MNLGGTNGQYIYVRDSQMAVKHSFNSNGEAYISSRIGVGLSNPAIKLAVGDSDTGLEGSYGNLYLRTNNQNRISIPADDSGIRFYSRTGTERMAIGNFGTSIEGNLIMNGGGYFNFPVRASAPFSCGGISQAGAAYVRTQSPEVLCVCQGDGSEWAWFGNANGNEIRCAD